MVRFKSYGREISCRFIHGVFCMLGAWDTAADVNC